jgi:hypothetical protein
MTPQSDWWMGVCKLNREQLWTGVFPIKNQEMVQENNNI